MTFTILVTLERFLREKAQAVMADKLDGADWMILEDSSVEFYLSTQQKVIKHVHEDIETLPETLRMLMDEKFQIIGVEKDNVNVKVENRLPNDIKLKVNDIEPSILSR